MIHKSVLLQEIVEGLNIQDGDVVVDCTLGNGGHSESIALLGKKIKQIAIDLDPDAIQRSKDRLKKFPNIIFMNGSFKTIDEILEKLGIKEADKIFYDLGLSSNQLEESGRGFTFQKNEPLLMTFGKTHEGFTAEDIVNDWDEENIRHVLRGYGEERFAGRIAKGIVRARERGRIKTTGELVEIITESVPKFIRRGKINPATKTFQALRIAVNDELGALQEGLNKAFKLLRAGGRIAVISFHSLEDRIVKQMFRAWSDTGYARLIFKKPITPSEKEIMENPRSRSAKLRILEKLNQV